MSKTEYVMDYSGWAEGMDIDTYLKVRDTMHTRKREHIVRCRDCKHCLPRPWYKDQMWCNLFGHDMTKTDGFCSWGKRKEDE